MAIPGVLCLSEIPDKFGIEVILPNFAREIRWLELPQQSVKHLDELTVPEKFIPSCLMSQLVEIPVFSMKQKRCLDD